MTATTSPDATAGAEADRLLMEIMLSPEGRVDPHSRYQSLRDLAPIHRSALGPLWVCTRYEDCRTVLRDNRFGKWDPDPDDPPPDVEMPLFASRREPSEFAQRNRSMLMMNPPDHTRIRGLVSRGFTPRRVDALRPAVEAMTDEILDAIPVGEPVDVLDVLGFPLPVRVIGELVGVPPADRDHFRPIVRAAATSLEPGASAEQLDRALEAATELWGYFGELIAARRSDPRDDLTSVLIAARDDADGAVLSEDEMIATLILVFAAGFETTTNLIGNGMYSLLRHPDEARRVRDDPALVGAAVEEILRFESPVQLDGRRANEPADIAGRPVAEGEWVITMLGAANRDPAVFDDPETFRVVARDTPPLSFASGIHYCLGASLARLEGQVVFAKVLDRFGTIELADEPAWRNTLILRGLDRLDVTFG